MRAVKAARRSTGSQQVASHAQERIEKMSADYAVRAEDHIDVTETRPQRMVGTGSWKHWLPSAILRICWGLRPQPRGRCKTHTRCTTKQPPPTKPSPLVASARCMASFYRAGHNYVQLIRIAVARRFVLMQRKAFETMGRFDSGVLLISLDDGDADATSGCWDQGSRDRHACTLALATRPARRAPRGGRASSRDRGHHFGPLAPRVAVPHAIQHLRGGGQVPGRPHRGPEHGLGDFVREAGSAPPGSSRCVSHAPALLGHDGPVAVRQHHELPVLRHAVDEEASRPDHGGAATARVREEAPQDRLHPAWAGAGRPCQQRLGPAPPLLESRLVDRHRATARSTTLADLKAFLRGHLRDGPSLYHYCPLGCHCSLEAAQDTLIDLLLTVFVRGPPPTPAWNKWTKVWPPLLFFTVFMQLAQTLPASLDGLCSLASDDTLDINEDDTIGLDDQQGLERQEQARFRKTSKWLNAPITADKLMALTVSIQYSLQVTGSFFASAGRFGDNTSCITTLANPATSVAWQCLRQYFDAFSSEQHALWTPLGGSSGWSTDLYGLASKPAFLEVGSLYKRFALAMDCRPWRISLLCVPDGSDAKKRAVAEQLWRSSECRLDPFSLKFKARCSNVDAILSQPMAQRLRDVFDMTPLTNIGSESRFASAQTRWSSSHGHHVGLPSTMASDRVLVETKLALDSAAGLANVYVRHASARVFLSKQSPKI